MTAARLLVILLSLSCMDSAQGAGFEYDRHFIVIAPNQELAAQVLALSNAHRKQFVANWLNGELPSVEIRTGIHLLDVSATESHACTWLKRGPDQTLHRIWLRGSAEELKSLLRHELVHVLLASIFAERLPVWVEEGVACLEDDVERKLIRQRIIAQYAATESWPDLGSLLERKSLRSHSQESYAVAESLTMYLLTLGDEGTLLRFALDGKRLGWEPSLRSHYSVDDVEALERRWETWASKTSQTYSAILLSSSQVPRYPVAR